jgi:RNA polymerase-binding transcription factor DksA
MTDTELELCRRQLCDRQNRNIDKSHLADKALGTSVGQASASLPSVPIHIPDFATSTFEKQFMEEVAAALERIEKGTFGCCEECGKTIPVARLEILPYTRFCVECAWKLQRGATEGRSSIPFFPNPAEGRITQFPQKLDLVR